MNKKHIVAIRPVGGVDKGDIWELLREVDLTVWSDKEKLTWPYTQKPRAARDPEVL